MNLADLDEKTVLAVGQTSTENVKKETMCLSGDSNLNRIMTAMNVTFILSSSSAARQHNLKTFNGLHVCIHIYTGLMTSEKCLLQVL